MHWSVTTYGLCLGFILRSRVCWLLLDEVWCIALCDLRSIVGVFNVILFLVVVTNFVVRGMTAFA